MRKLAVAVALVACVGVARAEDKSDPTGTWKWTVDFGGQTREVVLKLKRDGDKLTGTITGRNNQENKIEDGKFKDGEVSFKVTRERDGQKFEMKYTGKVSGDTLKGKTEFGDQSREFEAKRVKEKKDA